MRKNENPNIQRIDFRGEMVKRLRKVAEYRGQSTGELVRNLVANFCNQEIEANRHSEINE